MAKYIHLAAFNAENFYLLLDRPLTRDELDAMDHTTYLQMNMSIYNPNKAREKIQEIARIILDRNFDLIGLCEIGGMQTLETFNRLYLDERYDCYLHEENSRRGIYVGALVKKNRFPGLKVRSMPGDFSRNLLRLSLGQKEDELEVFIVHLKSQYGQDQGLEQRIREINSLVRLAPVSKCIIMGDFNGIAIPGEHQFEYEPILNRGFIDVLQSLGVPPDKRRTHYYFGGGQVHFTQLDYIFCTQDIKVVKAGVVEGAIPLNRKQRETLPSDHLFIWGMIRTGKTLVEKLLGWSKSLKNRNP